MKYALKCAKGVRGAPFKSEACTTVADCAGKCAADSQCVHSVFIERRSQCDLKREGALFDYTVIPLATWYFVDYDFNGLGEVDDAQIPVSPDNSGEPETTIPNNNSASSVETNVGGEQQPAHQQDTVVSPVERPECPAERASAPSSNRTSVTVPTCPDGKLILPLEHGTIANSRRTGDGKIYQAPDGATFYIQCCSHSPGPVIKTFIASDFGECMNEYSKTDGCHR